MKPKNSKERRSAFFKFLALFVITMLAILFAVYFNFKVPNKENDLLKAQVKAVEKEMEFQKNFSEQMETIKGMIDSLDVPGQNLPHENSKISNKLVELQKSIPTKDSTFRYDMYTNIVNTFSNLQQSEIELIDLNDAKNTIEEYKMALEKSNNELDQVKRDLFIARKQ
ncbi:type VI secretion system transmembrane protein TssO [uncultured Lacinutrix sp.]|uniref:type VI secretion system transmembrane protein TssO n=1 Tax=uncultured Lacinutrix sp. TaxID=574032 RepID=UPI00261AC414|nr:type VI secretion system transmembrane protein TssO [uncultured Lacinutrix sp.]